MESPFLIYAGEFDSQDAPKLKNSGLEAWISMVHKSSGISHVKSIGSTTQPLQSVATSESPPISAT